MPLLKPTLRAGDFQAWFVLFAGAKYGLVQAAIAILGHILPVQCLLPTGMNSDLC